MRYKNSDEEYNNMSLAEKTNFYQRCEQDPLFFIDNCVKAPLAGGYVHIDLYEPQRDIIRTFMEEHYIIMNKSRQTGGSFVVQCLCAWLVLFYDNYVIGIISRSGGESSSFNKKVLDILDNIPQNFIRPDNEDYEERNAQSFRLKKTGSKCISQAVSPQKPEGILRGNSISLLVIDEASFIDNIDIAFTAIMPATSQAQRVSANLGMPYGNFIISTPNGMRGRGQWYYDQWMRAKTGKSIYKAKSIHWRDIPGLDEEWYKHQCDTLNNDKKKILQELEMAFISSDGSYWSDDIQTHLNQIINMTDEDDNPNFLKTEYVEGATFYLFNKKYDRNRFCFIGVDVASAAGTDNSTIEIIDFITCEQVAELVGKMEPLTFAKIVKTIAVMFPNNLIIIENSGGYGLTVLNHLQDDENITFNIYGETKTVGLKDKKQTKHVPGLNTNSKTRPLIIEAMFNHVKDNLNLIISPRLASELLSLENKNGKVQASSGYNDDLVMAYAFCFYIRKYAPDAYQDLLAAIERGEKLDLTDMMSDDDIINEFAESSTKYEMNLSPQRSNYEKFGLKEFEYKKLTEYLTNKSDKEYIDLAFDELLNDNYDDNDKYSDDSDIYDMFNTLD